MDLKFILTKLRFMNRRTREYFTSLNSALFDMFIRSYGLSQKIRRSELVGQLNLITFLTKLERNMLRAHREKDKASEAYLTLMAKRKKKQSESQDKRQGYRRKLNTQ